MHWLDILIIVALGLGAIAGFKRGLVRQALGLAGIIAAFVLAFAYMDEAGAFATETAGLSANYAPIAGFVGIFIGVYMVVALVGRLIHRLVSALHLGALNRLLGSGLGLLSTGLQLSILFTILTPTGLIGSGMQDSSVLFDTVQSLLPSAWSLLTGQFPQIADLADKFGLPGS